MRIFGRSGFLGCLINISSFGLSAKRRVNSLEERVERKAPPGRNRDLAIEHEAPRCQLGERLDHFREVARQRCWDFDWSPILSPDKASIGGSGERTSNGITT